MTTRWSGSSLLLQETPSSSYRHSNRHWKDMLRDTVWGETGTRQGRWTEHLSRHRFPGKGHLGHVTSTQELRRTWPGNGGAPSPKHRSAVSLRVQAYHCKYKLRREAWPKLQDQVRTIEPARMLVQNIGYIRRSSMIITSNQVPLPNTTPRHSTSPQPLQKSLLCQSSSLSAIKVGDSANAHRLPWPSQIASRDVAPPYLTVCVEWNLVPLCTALALENQYVKVIGPVSVLHRIPMGTDLLKRESAVHQYTSISVMERGCPYLTVGPCCASTILPSVGLNAGLRSPSSAM